MSNSDNNHRPIWPWVLLVLWVCVIWGHSLMSGDHSSMESGFVVDLVRKGLYALYTSDIPFFKQLLIDHPGIMTVAADNAQLSFYVRKAAHFTEYFILGLLTFNAVRSAFRHPIISVIVIACVWPAVPMIDEFIQRFTPGRAGMTTDVLIDMSGFALAIALCVPFALLGALFRSLRGSR